MERTARQAQTRLLATALIVALAAGCGSIGPASISGDPFDDNRAVADSWKERMLLDIVRLRLAESGDQSLGPTLTINAGG